MQTEQWRPINGYQGLYSVSDQGRVKSHARRDSLGHRRRERIRKPTPSDRGYAHVTLHRNGERVTFTVHTLVLNAFVGWKPIGCEGSHLNGIRTDPRLENLLWETPKQNTARQIEHGTAARSERHGRAKLTEAQIREIRASSKSGVQLGHEYGVSPSLISRIRLRKSWRHLKDAA